MVSRPKQPKRDAIVSQIELSRLLAIRPETIRSWERRGCPVEEKATKAGQTSKYSVPAVVRWREDQARLAATGDLAAMDMAEARRRKLAAEAAMAEITLDTAKGSVAEVAVIMDVVGRGLDACRARLLSVGSKVAPEAAIETEAVVVKQLIDAAVNEALDEISGPAFEFAGGSNRDGAASVSCAAGDEDEVAADPDAE